MKINKTLYSKPVFEMLERGAAEIKGEKRDACLIYHKRAGLYISFGSASAVKELLPKSDIVLCSYNVTDENEFKQALNPEWESPCFHAVYNKKSILFESMYEIKKLDTSFTELIFNTYTLGFNTLADADFHINKIGMYGAFENGEIMGYIGRHTEGSMGLLEVFPEYSRKGAGQLLESYLIDIVLKEGLTPFAHIKDNNAASLKLQEKIGMEIFDEKVVWYGVNNNNVR